MSTGVTPNSGRAGVGAWRWVVIVLAFAAAVALSLEYGFDEPPLPPFLLLSVQMASILAYVASVVIDFVTHTSWRGVVRRRWLDLVFLVGGAILLGVEFRETGQPLLRAGTIYVVTIQAFLVARLLIGMVRWNLELSRRQLHTSRWLVASFAIAIAIGACLLALPKAVSPERRLIAAEDVPRHLAVSLFTATSATCVTGLTVYDTATDYSRFGQLIILILIQLGGLGIMISSTIIGMLVGQNLTLKQSLILQSDLHRETVGSMRHTAWFVIVTTFVLELIGAVLCYPMFADSVVGTADRIFYSVFHAVSAFCNAGFSLQSDSFESMGASWGLYVSIMPLIVLGGLGFPVLQDLWSRLTFSLSKKPPDRSYYSVFRWSLPVRRRPRRLQLHTKIVLWSSLGLIVVPAVMLFVFESVEWRGSAAASREGAVMADMTGFERARAALFQSITTRTAGFNTVAMDADSLSPASHFTLMLLMFVGGSPASTAGGIKTVTVAVLGLGLLATLRRKEQVELFGRTIPRELVERAGVLVVLMFALISAVVLALSMTEAATLRELLFEAVSACGTVGLTCGLTERLTIPGQAIIMLAMFAGRLGPLTLMVALADKSSPAHYEYPIERVTIG